LKIFGGTNWGNLGHPGGYTSYDYGSVSLESHSQGFCHSIIDKPKVIKENRAVTREKYSELKLQAQFFRVSPGYLIATPGNSTTRIYSQNAAITVTPLIGSKGSFFVVRHTGYSTTTPTRYTLTLPTSYGNISVPQLGGSLTLSGRDSKMHVTDYPMGDFSLLYSTAEILTWQTFPEQTVVVVYGGAGELHELAFKGDLGGGNVVKGSGVILMNSDDSTLMQWTTSAERKVVQFAGLTVYMLGQSMFPLRLCLGPGFNSCRPELGIQLLDSRVQHALYHRQRRLLNEICVGPNENSGTKG
jgi:hypothetical protein